jgi:hypothetical protein
VLTALLLPRFSCSAKVHHLFAPRAGGSSPCEAAGYPKFATCWWADGFLVLFDIRSGVGFLAVSCPLWVDIVLRFGRAGHGVKTLAFGSGVDIQTADDRRARLACGRSTPGVTGPP